MIIPRTTPLETAIDLGTDIEFRGKIFQQPVGVAKRIQSIALAEER